MNLKKTKKMKKSSTKFICATLVVAIISSGCASPATKVLDNSYSDSEKNISRAKQESSAAIFDGENAGSSATIQGAYYGSKSIPLRSDPVLPEVFHSIKYFSFPGQDFNIVEAAAKVSQVSGIPVRVSQDILKEIAVPTTAAQANTRNIQMDATASTAGILDQITTVDGLSWEYRDGVTYIQKYITRSYRLKTVFGSRKHTYKSGTTGSTEGKNSTDGGSSSSATISSGFNSQTSTEAVTDSDQAKSILEAVKQVLTKPSGNAVLTGTNTVIVTDSAEGQRRAEAIIDRENEILTRRVTYRLQVFSLADEDTDAGAFDLQALYTNATKYGLTVSSAASTMTGGGALSATILSGGVPGRFDGSKAIFKLLSERGKTVSVYDVNVPTRNLISMPMNLTTEIPFVAKITPAPSGGSGTATGAPGQELGKAVYGFKMDFTSNILDSNYISLQMAIGIVDLVEIRKVGGGGLESPVTTAFEMTPELFLKPFETAIITGYERTANKYNRNGLGKDWPLILGGGEYNATGKKEKIFILVTPTIVSNAY
ncbi:hypothetical protein IGS60_27455 [Janthinobacterium sp. FW305-128]|nr:hypothetical protein [Janthinobacterium sp. FW305-128]